MVYDPPTKLTNRRNEVSFIARGHSKHKGGNPFMQASNEIMAELHDLYGMLFG
jgi:hypothetical protein